MDNYIVCLSYGKTKGKAKEYTYFQPALYEKYTTEDGKLVWKYVQHIGRARRSKKLAIQNGKVFCLSHGYRWSDEKIRNWDQI